MKYIRVAFEGRVPLLFEYKVPPHLQSKIELGQKVVVPFRNQNKFGYIIEELSQSSQRSLKEVVEIVELEPCLSQDLLKLSRWMAEYYFAPMGEILAMMLPQKRVKKLSLRETSPIAPRKEAITLTKEQTEILKRIYKDIRENKFSPYLLLGVTGSGKTEVYIQAIKYLLKINPQKQAIVLVPEISLTPQTVERFERAFGEPVVILHSRLTPGIRYHEWQEAKAGKKRIIIGARSAIFAPVRDLGLVVVDEEHDSSYKQADAPRYHAREVAVMRAKFTNAVVILGSATPSLETFYQVHQGKFKLGELTTRVDNRKLPQVKIISLGSRKSTSNISPFLKNEIAKRVTRGEQCILFLNRRGFFTTFICRECGYVFRCKNCSVALVYHAPERMLLCHYCGFQEAPPQGCPQCKGRRIERLGSGTEKLEEEVKHLFPSAKVQRFDVETTRRKNALENILTAFKNKEIDILIGTQMVTKGLDFPNVTLVGVINADIGLNLPDFRAAERTFQLLTQVAGRAGRGPKGGEVLIQTFNPSHYTLKCAQEHNFKKFYQEESNFRSKLGYPPFSKIIKFEFTGSEEKEVFKKAEEFGKLIEKFKENSNCFFQILGPAPAPIYKVKKKIRYHIILLLPFSSPVENFLREILLKKYFSKKAMVKVDVDPLHLL
jgi:primosomal protein N' (replication factor Y)